MIGFLLKKSFFDAWDNMIRLVLLNVGFLLIFSLMVTLPFLGDNPSLGSLFVLGLPGFLLLFLYLGFISPMLQEISDYKSPELKESFALFRKNLKVILVFAAMNLVVALLSLLSFPFYMQMGGVLGSLGAGLVFWIVLFWCGSIQYFLPLMSRLGGGPVKILKKSFLIFLDNPGFSVFLMFWSLLLTILSVFTAFLLPGIASVALFHQVAFKLRLYKYDYLEEQKAGGKMAIPWDALLSEDRESVGPRSIKGMIFPWKD